MNVPFSPPDISEEEIKGVVDTLQSGWITTGPKTKEFEKRIAAYCGTDGAVCLNSATACMEMTLRLFGIGPGDEVITTAYTYTATASSICHTGAKPVIVDTQKDSLEMDYEKLEQAITPATKAVMPVDVAGVLCDYSKIYEIVEKKKELYQPSENPYQKALGRILVLADCAHGFGAEKEGKKSGRWADFTSFSFHAVKNLTTAEGGAVVWKPLDGIDSAEIYREYMLLSLHGQTKDALSKTKAGAWEYDILFPAYKCNMTDIQAAIGLAQLDRYEGLLKRRRLSPDTMREWIKLPKKQESNCIICHIRQTMPFPVDICIFSAWRALQRRCGMTLFSIWEKKEWLPTYIINRCHCLPLIKIWDLISKIIRMRMRSLSMKSHCRSIRN